MYRVIKFFSDREDDYHAYNVGDKFPRDGVEVSPKRIAKLAGSMNRQGTPLIEEVKEQVIVEKPEPEPVVAVPKPEPEKKSRRGRKAKAEEDT